jgi:hypothetical protein
MGVMLGLLAATLAVLAAVSVLLTRRVRGLLGDVNALGEQVRELTGRLDAAEQSVSAAVARTEAAEAVLVGKGLADEEDLEAARRRSAGGADTAGDLRGRGELH